MNLSKEEKLMYEVMKAIHDSRIPMNFKGSMVLRACLIEAGYQNEIRHTVDIDANWYSESPPSAKQMEESLQNALSKYGIALNVKLYRMYGEKRSAGFELSDVNTGDIIFTMDVDVNRPVPPTRLYEVAGVQFNGVAPIQMIADKTSVVSSDKVFRRIKDVVDLYYISSVFPFDCAAVLENLNNSDRVLGNFNGFLNRQEELRHSYDKFRFTGDVSKPPFDEVYSTVKTYIKDVLPE